MMFTNNTFWNRLKLNDLSSHLSNVQIVRSGYQQGDDRVIPNLNTAIFYVLPTKSRGAQVQNIAQSFKLLWIVLPNI